MIFGEEKLFMAVDEHAEDISRSNVNFKAGSDSWKIFANLMPISKKA